MSVDQVGSKDSDLQPGQPIQQPVQVSVDQVGSKDSDEDSG